MWIVINTAISISVCSTFFVCVCGICVLRADCGVYRMAIPSIKQYKV